MALTGKINLTASASLVSTRDLGSAAVSEALSAPYVVADGAGAGQATQVWGDERSLAASTSEDLDLSGTLVNGLGDTVSFTRITGIIVKADEANGDTITVGGAAANQFDTIFLAATDAVVIRPGGTFALFTSDATGYVVTAGTGDLLKILNDDSGAAGTYQIWILGSEA